MTDRSKSIENSRVQSPRMNPHKKYEKLSTKQKEHLKTMKSMVRCDTLESIRTDRFITRVTAATSGIKLNKS